MELIDYKSNLCNQSINNSSLKKVLNFLKNHDLGHEKKGIHNVSDDFSYNIIEMKTISSQEATWESHRKFYDVHIVLEGKEQIAFNHLSNMRLLDYSISDDWQKMTGNELFNIILTPGKMLLLDPNDAHKTGILVNEKSNLKKIVFKIKI